MQNLKYPKLLVFFFLCSIQLLAQDPSLIIEKQQTQKGEEVRVCILAQDFSDLISLQFTVSWNTSVIQYKRTEDFGLAGLSIGNINDQQIDNGILPFVWFDGAGSGINLPDSSVLFCIYFEAIGDIGDISPVELVNAPTPIQLGILENDQVVAADFSIESGEVAIVENLIDLSADIEDNSCYQAGDGSIDLNLSGGIMPYSFLWEGPDNYSASTANIQNLFAGNYRVTITDVLGRPRLDSFVISEPPRIQVTNLATSPASCTEATGSVEISADGGQAPYQYDIGNSPNSTGSFQGLAAGNYLLVISDANNCMVDTMFNIPTQESDNTLSLGPDQRLCPGDSLVLSSNQSSTTYRWFRNGVPLSETGRQLMLTQAGNYRLEAVSPEGCPISAEVTIGEANAEVFASGDPQINLGDSTQLNVTEGNTYRWTPRTGLSCIDCRSPMASPITNTTYQVEVVTLDGCISSDSVSIEVVIPEEELRFTPVTFISPNGDDKNDVLFFPGLETYTSNEIKIYSRWGQIVYSKVDYQIKGALWDGTLRGQELPAGVYYYVLRVDEQNLVVRKNLTLIRDN